jgi:hypothetical protein
MRTKFDRDEIAFACTLGAFLRRGEHDGGLSSDHVAEWCRCSVSTVRRWSYPGDPTIPDTREWKLLRRNAPAAIFRELRVAMFGDADAPDDTPWSDGDLDPTGDGKVDGDDVTAKLAECGELNASTLAALLKDIRGGKRFRSQRATELQAELSRLGVLVSQTKAALRKSTLQPASA